jgi:uncharacterized protein YxjI
MEIRIECQCGTRFKFDVEPVNGRMPVGIGCPDCKLDATAAANASIAQQLGLMAPPPVVAAPHAVAAIPPPSTVGAGLRLAGAAARQAPAPSEMLPPEAAYEFSGSSGRSLLNRTLYFVKERVGLLKLVDTYDIFDPASGRQIGIAKEEPPAWAKWLRLLVKKHLMPTVVNIYEAEGAPPVMSIHRGFTFLRQKIRVVSGGRSLGYFKSKLFSLGGGFHVFDDRDQNVAEVKGNWKGWDFKFLSNSGREIGTVTKKWAGLGRELFTSADNYVISLGGLGGANPDAAALLLAAGLAIDIVLKEAQ